MFGQLGYRDGVTAGREASVQDGFDAGFVEGVKGGVLWGRLSGIIRRVPQLRFFSASPSHVQRVELLTLWSFLWEDHNHTTQQEIVLLRWLLPLRSVIAALPAPVLLARGWSHDVCEQLERLEQLIQTLPVSGELQQAHLVRQVAASAPTRKQPSTASTSNSTTSSSPAAAGNCASSSTPVPPATSGSTVERPHEGVPGQTTASRTNAPSACACTAAGSDGICAVSRPCAATGASPCNAARGTVEASRAQGAPHGGHPGEQKVASQAFEGLACINEAERLLLEIHALWCQKMMQSLALEDVGAGKARGAVGVYEDAVAGGLLYKLHLVLARMEEALRMLGVTNNADPGGYWSELRISFRNPAM